jgi:deoxyribodipyrimidine photo-lyase
MKTLYWLTQDLRLDDNPTLAHAAKTDALVLVFCVNPRWFSPYRYHLASMGSHRWNFLQESLSDLNHSLIRLDQNLHIIYERPEIALSAIIKESNIDRLVCSRQFGFDERETLRYIVKKFPKLVVEEIDSYTLFDKSNLPYGESELPKTYSQFRKKVESLPAKETIVAPASLPPSIAQPSQSMRRPDWVPDPVATECAFQGGEAKAAEHLKVYFDSGLPLNYKVVRNSLEGWENSSKMSAWLNNGSLSVRRLKQTITQFEEAKGANDSTYWLFIELLWREYFNWLALQLGVQLFSFKGSAKASPLTCLYPERFQKWCYGNTPYPLVNACMQQLLKTGYLSNRGRQIAASCLVSELEVDWRYGAAWFEHQLVDYDVAVNWGNWQYIAGVGADPRGGRHFNLEKQTEMFDSDGSYRARWAGVAGAAILDSTDAADWPLG